MIVMHESTSFCKMSKPVICRKCDKGRLGNIPIRSTAALSKRGKPPPNECTDYVQVKCHVCSSLWLLTIENRGNG